MFTRGIDMYALFLSVIWQNFFQFSATLHVLFYNLNRAQRNVIYRTSVTMAEKNTMCVLAQTRVVDDELDGNSSYRPSRLLSTCWCDYLQKRASHRPLCGRQRICVSVVTVTLAFP